MVDYLKKEHVAKREHAALAAAWRALPARPKDLNPS
jgi:hypothetical protein